MDGAYRGYRETVRLNPTHAGAHNNLGITLWAKGDIAGAMAAHEESLRLEPKNHLAHFNLGNILCDVKQDFDGALAHFRKALEIDPKFAPGRQGLDRALKLKAERDARTAPPPREVKR